MKHKKTALFSVLMLSLFILGGLSLLKPVHAAGVETILAIRFPSVSNNIMTNTTAPENYNSTRTINGSMYLGNLYPNDWYNDSYSNWQMYNNSGLTSNITTVAGLGYYGPAFYMESVRGVNLGDGMFFYDQMQYNKSLNATIIDRYDAAGYNGNLRNFTVDVSFQYNYTQLDVAATNVANFTLNSTTFDLLDNGGLGSLNVSMPFNSANASNMEMSFNISHGQLLVWGMNYTITFDSYSALNADNTRMRNISQSFTLDYSTISSLSTYQQTDGVWKLGYNLIARNTSTTDLRLDPIWNGINNNRFHIVLGIQWENAAGIAANATYTLVSTNNTFTLSPDVDVDPVDIAALLTTLSATKFLGFYLTLYVAGNPSYLTLDDVVLQNNNAYEAPVDDGGDGDSGGGGDDDVDDVAATSIIPEAVRNAIVLAALGGIGVIGIWYFFGSSSKAVARKSGKRKRRR